MQDYEHIRRMYLVDGLSQRQIAQKLGISRNTVTKYCVSGAPSELLSCGERHDAGHPPIHRVMPARGSLGTEPKATPYSQAHL